MNPGERLKAFLQSHGDLVKAGAAPGEIAQFERRYGVSLPLTFRDYLLAMNGSAENYGLGILRLWALKDIKPLSDEISGNSPQCTGTIHSLYSAPIAHSEDYYVFADALYESQLYAIRIVPDGQDDVILLDGGEPKTVAETFTQFVSLLIASPAKLRLPTD